jgi:hypothetical protein
MAITARAGPSAAGGFQQERNADAGHREVHGGQVAGTLGKLLVHDEQIAGDGGTDEAEGDVGKGTLSRGELRMAGNTR